MLKTSLSVVLAGLAAMAAMPTAIAGTPSGPYAMFKYCPYTNPSVGSCVINTTDSGVFVIGNTTLPIDKPIVLQGGVENLGPSPLYQAVGAPTLSAPPAKVPGGLLGIMNRGYSRALGVKCTHCHMEDDFASDDMREKQAAREMAAMHKAINDQLAKMKHLEGTPEDRFINCSTCHRGKVDPHDAPR